MELMIVVAVIAILAAVAYPSYRDSIVRSNRTTAQGDLQAAAAAMNAFRAQNFTYQGASLGAGGVYRAYSPESGSAQYDFVFADGSTTNPTAGAFVIYAKPKAGTNQAGTGALGINQAGERCWNASSDASCTPGAAAQGWK